MYITNTDGKAAVAAHTGLRAGVWPAAATRVGPHSLMDDLYDVRASFPSCAPPPLPRLCNPQPTRCSPSCPPSCAPPARRPCPMPTPSVPVSHPDLLPQLYPSAPAPAPRLRPPHLTVRLVVPRLRPRSCPMPPDPSALPFAPVSALRTCLCSSSFPGRAALCS